MSEAGAIVDALEVIIRAALPDMAAGVEGFERKLREVTQLYAEAFPHCFQHTSVSDTTLEGLYQLSVGRELQFDLWFTDYTPEETAETALDAIATAVRADETLGGLVDRSYLSRTANTAAEPIGNPFRVASFVLSTEVIG